MTTTQDIDPASLVARIIRELEANPSAKTLLLRTLLVEEFLLLPAKVDQLQEDVSDIKTEQAATNRRLDRLEEKFDNLEKQSAYRGGQIDNLVEQVSYRGGQIDNLEKQFAHRGGQIDNLEKQFAHRGGQIDNLVEQVSYRGGQIDNLLGESQERRIADNVYSVISQPLGLRRTRVLRSIGQPTSRDLLDPIEDAWEEDRITDQQFNRILATDLIFTARRRGQSSAEQTPVWCAVEISTTIREDDVTRVRESADAIAQAVDADALAVVAGPAIDDDARELLETEDVAFRPTPEL